MPAGAYRCSAMRSTARRPLTKEAPVERKIAGYGWNRDLPDGRDFMYGAPPEVVRKLPESVDLRPDCPPVYDQGQLGSCTANAIGAALQFDQMKQKQKS